MKAHQPLNEFEIEEARECFKTLDPESKGVTAAELMGAMRALGKTYSDEEIQGMISSADKHGKGRVDFQDFLALLENVSKCATRYYVISKQQFQNTACIGICNRQVLITYFGYFSHSQQKAKGSHEAAFVEVFEAIDSDKDGSITVQDIVTYMASRGKSVGKFYSRLYKGYTK
jgi:Ca2+-binding EF-hand superfamily protein